MKGEGGYLLHYFGLVRDGAAWDKDHGARASTDAWYMHSYGRSEEHTSELQSLTNLCGDVFPFSAKLDDLVLKNNQCQ